MTEEAPEMITFDSPDEVRRKVFARFDNELARVRGERDTVSFDVETTAGEREARSYVHGIRTLKADVDRERKRATAGFREQVKIVNEAGAAIIDDLEALIEHHFRPIAEKQRRIEELEWKREQVMEKIRGFVTDRGQNGAPLGTEALGVLIAAAKAVELDPELMGPRMDEAEALKARSIERLGQYRDEARAREEREAELERLRENERKQQEEIERLQRAERERVEREQAEARAKREAEERAAREQAEAEERARRDAAAKERREELKEQRRQLREACMQRLVDLSGCSLPQAERILRAVEQGDVPGMVFSM